MRKALAHVSRLPRIQEKSSLPSSQWWGTLSKAFEKSSMTTLSCLPLSRSMSISCVVSRSWVSVECLAPNQWLFSQRILLLSSCLLTITRAASWGSDCRKWLFSAVKGGIWTPHSPVMIKISADKRPLNQFTVKNLFFPLIIKTFWHLHHRIVHEKAINLSVWMKEISTLLVNLHIIFSRMQRVNQHARPSII